MKSIEKKIKIRFDWDSFGSRKIQFKALDNNFEQQNEKYKSLNFPTVRCDTS